MRVLVASSNPHKLDEIAAIFASQRQAAIEALDKLACLTGAMPPDAPAAAPSAIELVTLRDIGLAVPEPHEDQPTFEGNALLKAEYYASVSRLPTLADDSGLAVDTLEGQPGVLSARYAGVSGPRDVVDPANTRLLLERLAGVPDEQRVARFVCAMALAWPDNDGDGRSTREPIVVRGQVVGRILGDGLPPRGEHGFGYDPVFFLPELGQTMAELAPAQKNALSHRARAAGLMWERLQPILVSP